MRILINAPMARDKIIALLCEYNENGVQFGLIKSEGIRLEFEASNIEGDAAVGLVKKLIRETDFGKVLYFSVNAL